MSRFPSRIPKPPFTTFRDYERVIFEAQRAEARGEFRNMLTDVDAEMIQAIGAVAAGENNEEHVGSQDG